MRKSTTVIAILSMAYACHAQLDGVALYFSSNYNFQSWCGTTKTNYQHALVEWELPALDIPTNSIPGVSCQSPDVRPELFMLVSANDSEVLCVDGVICTNVVSAHESIIYRLSHMSTTVLHQMASNDIGDVCFTYPSATNNFSTVTFARNNLMVSVSSYVPEIAATNIAKQLDLDILSKRREH